jgi:hypothetical protein
MNFQKSGSLGANMISQVAFLLALTCTASSQELVGKRVPPFPNGMQAGGGGCIAIAEDPRHRSISILMSGLGKEIGVYASVADGRDERGKAFSIVTDVIPYPKVNEGHHLDWSNCRYNGIEDSAVVAVVKRSKQPWLRSAGWAYRVENVSGKFLKLDPRRVDCYNTALEAD